jgi:hypothetical protein
MKESPEEKYRRLQSEIQSAILQNYPNPDRNGCPGQDALGCFAANPDSIKAEYETDEQCAWYHVTHCSPCYASFLELRKSGRNQRHEMGSTPWGDGRVSARRPGWQRCLDWFTKRQHSPNK